MGLGPHDVTVGLGFNETHVAPRQRCQITDLALRLRSYQCCTRWDNHLPALTGKVGSRDSIEQGKRDGENGEEKLGGEWGVCLGEICLPGVVRRT